MPECVEISYLAFTVDYMIPEALAPISTLEESGYRIAKPSDRDVDFLKCH